MLVGGGARSPSRDRGRSHPGDSHDMTGPVPRPSPCPGAPPFPPAPSRPRGIRAAQWLWGVVPVWQGLAPPPPPWRNRPPPTRALSGNFGLAGGGGGGSKHLAVHIVGGGAEVKGKLCPIPSGPRLS